MSKPSLINKFAQCSLATSCLHGNLSGISTTLAFGGKQCPIPAHLRVPLYILLTNVRPSWKWLYQMGNRIISNLWLVKPWLYPRHHWFSIPNQTILSSRLHRFPFQVSSPLSHQQPAVPAAW